MVKRSRIRLLPLVSIGVSGALVFGACGDTKKDKTTTANGPVANVTLGYVANLSGDAILAGRDSAKLAIDQANARNPKIHIDMKVFDTSKVTDVASLGPQIVDDASIIGINGPNRSGDTATLLPALAKGGVVMISPAATRARLGATVPGNKVFHRIVADDDQQAMVLKDYIAKRLGAKRVAYVYDETPYGSGLAESAEKLISGVGVATAFMQEADATTKDYSPILDRMKSEKADLLFYGGYYQGAIELRKQMVSAGLKADFVGGDGVLTSEFAVDGAGAYVTCVCGLYTENSPGAGGEFARQYEAAYGKDPTGYAAEAYDATMVLIKGIEAGARTREALLDYVNTMPPYQGVTKTIQFDQNGDVKSSSVFIFGSLGGKISPIESTDALL